MNPYSFISFVSSRLDDGASTSFPSSYLDILLSAHSLILETKYLTLLLPSFFRISRLRDFLFPITVLSCLSPCAGPIIKSAAFVKINSERSLILFYLPDFSCEKIRAFYPLTSFAPRVCLSRRVSTGSLPRFSGSHLTTGQALNETNGKACHGSPATAAQRLCRPSQPISLYLPSNRYPVPYSSIVNSHAHQYSSGCASGGQATQRVLIRGSTADAKWLYSSTPVVLQG